MNELNTHIFFDVLGFDRLKGEIRRVQRSKHKTVRKRMFHYVNKASLIQLFLHFADELF